MDVAALHRRPGPGVGARGARPAASRGCRADRLPGGRRAGRRGRRGPGAPRREAGQRVRRSRGDAAARVARGLRAEQGDGLAEWPDRHRDVPRDDPVRRARADPGGGGGPQGRRLRAGRRPLQGADRRGALPPRPPGGRGDGPHHRAAAAPLRAGGLPTRARRRDRPGDGQGSRAIATPPPASWARPRWPRRPRRGIRPHGAAPPARRTPPPATRPRSRRVATA